MSHTTATFLTVTGCILLIIAAFGLAPRRVARVKPPETASIARQLADCLPKSDMQSHRTCTRLLAGITDFRTCAAAGLPVMESDPPRCATPDGRTFTQPTVSGTSPETVSIEGKPTCLSHKGNPQVTTMECAFGIATDEGRAYALDLSGMGDRADSVTSGSRIRVTGTRTAPGGPGAAAWDRYEIAGIVHVTDAVILAR